MASICPGLRWLGNARGMKGTSARQRRHPKRSGGAGLPGGLAICTSLSYTRQASDVLPSPYTAGSVIGQRRGTLGRGPKNGPGAPPLAPGPFTASKIEYWLPAANSRPSGGTRRRSGSSRLPGRESDGIRGHVIRLVGIEQGAMHRSRNPAGPVRRPVAPPGGGKPRAKVSDQSVSASSPGEAGGPGARGKPGPRFLLTMRRTPSPHLLRCLHEVTDGPRNRTDPPLVLIDSRVSYQKADRDRLSRR